MVFLTLAGLTRGLRKGGNAKPFSKNFNDIYILALNPTVRHACHTHTAPEFCEPIPGHQ